MARHIYQIYANTKGIIKDTTAIVLRVKKLDKLFKIVNEECKSTVDG